MAPKDKKGKGKAGEPTEPAVQTGPSPEAIANLAKALQSQSIKSSPTQVTTTTTSQTGYWGDGGDGAKKFGYDVEKWEEAIKTVILRDGAGSILNPDVRKAERLKLNKADVELIVTEFGVSTEEAQNVLIDQKGDVVKALLALAAPKLAPLPSRGRI